MLDRVDVHCTWVSQAVLDLLPEEIPDVPGGEIIRTPGMGVFCDNAMDIVMSLWPRPTPAKKKEFVKSAMRELHKVGLVGMHDAGVFPRDVALYDEMSSSSREDEWTLRVYAMLECAERNTFCPEEDVVRRKGIEHPGGMFTVRSVKLFAGMSPLFSFSLYTGLLRLIYHNELTRLCKIKRRRLRIVGLSHDRPLHRQTLCLWFFTGKLLLSDLLDQILGSSRVPGKHPRHWGPSQPVRR